MIGQNTHVCERQRVLGLERLGHAVDHIVVEPLELSFLGWSRRKVFEAWVGAVEHSCDGKVDADQAVGTAQLGLISIGAPLERR